MKAFLMVGLLGWVLSGLALSAQATRSCAMPDTDASKVALQYVRRLVSVPSRDQMRRGMGFPRMDSSLVVLVQDEAKCARTLALISASLAPGTPRPSQVVLVEVGRKYLARTPGLRVGGDDRQFILNAALDRILRDY